jgi:hypothetical protein
MYRAKMHSLIFRHGLLSRSQRKKTAIQALNRPKSDMKPYKLLAKGIFESSKKFEDRLNDMSEKGWRAIAMTSDTGGGLMVLLERMEKDYPV